VPGSFDVRRHSEVRFDFGNQIAKMTVDPHLVETVLKFMSGVGVLRTRTMFGGVYIYCDDLFVATVHDNTLYFKANASTAPEYIERGYHSSLTRRTVEPPRFSTFGRHRRFSLEAMQ
jgi:hypothetical protein